MGLLASLLGLLGLPGCDAQRLAALEPGVSTEADVRARFGPPDEARDGEGGTRVLDYSRQPAGHENHRITLGPDGRVARIEQLLTAERFARIQPGQTASDVRLALGRPMRVTPFALQRETHYDWRYLAGPNVSDSRVFTVVVDEDQRVVRTSSAPDPDLRPGGH